jgi:hypothetical protein
MDAADIPEGHILFRFLRVLINLNEIYEKNLKKN